MNRIRNVLANISNRTRQLSLGAIVIVAITIIGFYADVFSLGWLPEGLALVKPTEQPFFDYQVRVLDIETYEYISGAMVTIEFTNDVPIDDYSDSNGYVRLRIPIKYQGKPGRLRVKTEWLYTARSTYRFRFESTSNNNRFITGSLKRNRAIGSRGTEL